MELYAKYLKELKNFEIVYDENGFATYGWMERGNEKLCYIEDIFVVPEKRKEGLASKYADQITLIAKERGCNKLLGSVVPSLENSHYRMLVLLGYGFKLDSSQYDVVYYTKEI